MTYTTIKSVSPDGKAFYQSVHDHEVPAVIALLEEQGIPTEILDLPYDGLGVFTPGYSVVPAHVKAETTRRITEYLSANTRDNAVAGFVIAMADDPKFESEEVQFMREFVLAGNSWIVEMREVCQKLIKDNSSTFRDDEHWPEVPAIVADNYKKF